MGRVVYQEVDLTLASDATQDIWSIIAGATMPIRLLGWELTSDATSASMIELNLHRITAAGSGGSASSTEESAVEDHGTITAGVRFEDTTPGTDGGVLMRHYWEQLGPVGHIWTPEMAPIAKATDGFALTMNTAATPTLAGFLCWEELAG
jgi:hypothetical protein